MDGFSSSENKLKLAAVIVSFISFHLTESPSPNSLIYSVASVVFMHSFVMVAKIIVNSRKIEAIEYLGLAILLAIDTNWLGLMLIGEITGLFALTELFSVMACSRLTRAATGAHELTKNLLIKAHAEYDINYQGYLANHLPHGLYTLCALGASTSRLQQFYDTYVKKLEPISASSTAINSSNWNTNIGSKGSYSDYLRYFDDELEAKGLKSTFDLYFSQLMGESLGAALHPLINVGYAMEFQNPILLSEGLAYICTEPLKDTSQILSGTDTVRANSDTSIIQLIEELQSINFPEVHNDGWNFHKKTEFLLENYGTVFRDLIAKWDLSQGEKLSDKLNELTEASILGVFGTYPKQIDFFLLHGLTGNHAVRIIFHYLPEALQRQILKVNLLGFLTDYVIQGYPKVDINFITGYKNTNLGENPSWDIILEKTISTDDVHVQKVVRCLTHYMDSVPLAERSKLFTDTFLKQCAIKIIDLIQEEDDYLF